MLLDLKSLKRNVLPLVLVFLLTSCLKEVEFRTYCAAGPIDFLPITHNYAPDDILFKRMDGADEFRLSITRTYYSPAKEDVCFEKRFGTSQCDPRWACFYEAYINGIIYWSDGNEYEVKYSSTGYGEPLDKVDYKFRDESILTLKFPFDSTSSNIYYEELTFNDKTYKDVIRQGNPDTNAFFRFLFYNRDYGVVIAETTDGHKYLRQ